MFFSSLGDIRLSFTVYGIELFIHMEPIIVERSIFTLVQHIIHDAGFYSIFTQYKRMGSPIV